MYNQQQQDVYQDPADAGLRVRFFEHSVRDRYQSELNGKDIYKTKVYIEIVNPSNKNSVPVRPAIFDNMIDDENKVVVPSDIDRFPRQYQQFLQGKEQKDGLQIKVWALKPDDGLIAALEKHGITTVEELAYYQKDDLNGIATFYQLKQKAIKYLKSQEDNAEINKVLAENATMKEQIEFLQQQMKEISEASKKLIENANNQSQQQPSTTPLGKKELKKKSASALGKELQDIHNQEKLKNNPDDDSDDDDALQDNQ